jgi:hypothetical protein
MMSNETFAILALIAVGAGMALVCGVLYRAIVHRDPARKPHQRNPVRFKPADGEATIGDSVSDSLLARLRENATTTHQLAGDARRLATKIEDLSRTMTRRP